LAGDDLGEDWLMHGFVAPPSPSVDLVNLGVTAVSAGSHDGHVPQHTFDGQLTTC
jgi:hypothetical protein